MVYVSKNTEDTRGFGARLAEKLATGSQKRRFIALRGEMGVGKTAFCAGFASYFGIKGVKSPTYTVVNEYSADVNIYHFDMYRIEDEDELFSIGYEDYLKGDGYIIVEWSENIEGYIPPDALYVSIERMAEDEDMRLIKVYTRSDGHEDFSI